MVDDISIHAAREGGDKMSFDWIHLQNISIHAAREGGDSVVNAADKSSFISIHAAREGGDSANGYDVGKIDDFNPRRP